MTVEERLLSYADILADIHDRRIMAFALRVITARTATTADDAAVQTILRLSAWVEGHRDEVDGFIAAVVDKLGLDSQSFGSRAYAHATPAIVNQEQFDEELANFIAT